MYCLNQVQELWHFSTMASSQAGWSLGISSGSMPIKSSTGLICSIASHLDAKWFFSLISASMCVFVFWRTTALKHKTMLSMMNNSEENQQLSCRQLTREVLV
jgi:hypothetical protein